MTNEIQKLHHRINELIQREDTMQKNNNEIFELLNERCNEIFEKIKHTQNEVLILHSVLDDSKHEFDASYRMMLRTLEKEKNGQIDENRKIYKNLEDIQKFIGTWAHDEDCAIEENEDCDCMNDDNESEQTSCDHKFITQYQTLSNCEKCGYWKLLISPNVDDKIITHENKE